MRKSNVLLAVAALAIVVGCCFFLLNKPDSGADSSTEDGSASVSTEEEAAPAESGNTESSATGGSSGEPTSPGTTVAPVDATAAYYVSEQDGVELYAQADDSSEVVAWKSYGTSLAIVGTREGWGMLQTDSNETAWVDMDSVNVYDQNAKGYQVNAEKYNGVLLHTTPDMDGATTIRIPHGTILKSTQVSNGFLYINYSGEDSDSGNIVANAQGYVALIWLTPLYELPEDLPDDEEEELTPAYYISHQDGAYVHSQPSTDSTSIAKLPYGTSFNLLNQSGDWGQFAYGEEMVWIDMDWIDAYDWDITTYTVNAEKHNGALLHTAADMDSDATIRIPSGAIVESAGIENGFLYVVYSGMDNDSGSYVEDIEGYIALIWLDPQS